MTCRWKRRASRSRSRSRSSTNQKHRTLHSRGVDHLEFYLSTNVGEQLKPLNRIASGGRLSRYVLAMKKVLRQGGIRRDGRLRRSGQRHRWSHGGDRRTKTPGHCEKPPGHLHHSPAPDRLLRSYALPGREERNRRADETDVRTLAEDERLEEITRMLGDVESRKDPGCREGSVESSEKKRPS